MASKYAFVLVGRTGEPRWSRFERFRSNVEAIRAARQMAEAEIGGGGAAFALMVGRGADDKVVRWLGAFEWRGGVAAWKPTARSKVGVSEGG